MYVTAKHWHARLQAAKDAAARWPNEDDDNLYWPVLVTDTREHVVWVEAETHSQALRRAGTDTWEYIKDGNETCVTAYMEVARPKDEWDWEKVYEGDYFGSYQGLKCDAHVQARDDWFRGIAWAHLDATIEDETRDAKPAVERKTCTVCRRWREDGHEETDRHQRETAWAARSAEAAVAS